jgi:nicotinamide phosphoribosyltransferase
VKILGEKFGYVVNEKGYKVLNNVRIIQGDGIDYNVIDNILSSFLISGWSAENIGFGMGGALLQHVNRDTYNFAMKCSAIKVNGKWRHVFKKPVTDNGKNSKKGRVTLYRERDGNFRNGVEDWETPVLVNVFENGKLLKEYSFEEVRNNSEI